MSFDWTQSHTDQFLYRVVSWPDFKETAELSNVTGCTIEENGLSDLKATGSLDYIGSLDLGDDMVRAYSVSWAGGVGQIVCHGTFLAATGQDQYGAVTRSGSADLYSTLKVLQDWKTDQTYVVAAGSNPVDEAAAICFAANLPCVKTGYDGELEDDAVYDFGTSMLSIVNSLLDAAGYAAARPNEYGYVLLEPYTDPSSKEVSVSLTEDGGAFLASPEFSCDLDTSSVYNVVTYIGTDANGNSIRAQAINQSEGSRWSTKSRHRIISYCEQVQDATTQAALSTKANNKLKDAMMEVEHIEISHPWASFDMGDAVLVNLPSRGIDNIRYSVTKRTCKMTPGMPCTTTARRFVSFN